MSPTQGWVTEEAVTDGGSAREAGRPRGQAGFAPEASGDWMEAMGTSVSPPQMGMVTVPSWQGVGGSRQRGWEPGFLRGGALSWPLLPAPFPAEPPAHTQELGARAQSWFSLEPPPCLAARGSSSSPVWLRGVSPSLAGSPGRAESKRGLRRPEGW